jgi:leader peptidase (prepilin peptidase)/N-methyltransferase
MIGLIAGIYSLLGVLLSCCILRIKLIPSILTPYQLRLQTKYASYPWLELISALGAFCIGWRYSLSWQSASGLVLTQGLLILALIDAEHLILPDSLIAFLWLLGLVVNLFNVWVPLQSAVLGCAIAYSILSIFSAIYYQCTGRIGLGQGDVKLFSVLGMWLGWSELLNVLCIASFTGLLWTMVQVCLHKRSYEAPIPFGPFLSLGGWLSLLGLSAYLDIFL